MSAVDVLSWSSLVVGGSFVLIGGIGVVRFPDLFTRMHAASLTDTLGAGLILIGLMLQAGFTLPLAKLVLILLLILFTSPASTHALAKAALHGGVRPWMRRDRTEDDDAGDH